MKKLCLAIAALSIVESAIAQTTLDQFTFDDALFGNTLMESDAGAFSFGNWLNIANTDPGNPGYLTGVSFDTGIANIGLSGTPVYTIGYGTPIINNPGDDLGIVVARYSEDDVTLAVSTDGSTFTSDIFFGAATAIDTGVHREYFYGGGGPFEAELFVHSVDLSDFGIASGAGILAAKVTGSTQLDLIRVAGYAVPEPGSWIAITLGVMFLWPRRRRSLG